MPRDIFEAAGLSEELIGLDRIKTAGKRWRAAYRKSGIEGLQEIIKNDAKSNSLLKILNIV